MDCDKIKSLSEKYRDYLIGIRHYLHAHPELSFMEYKTAGFIRNELEKSGIIVEKIGETGLIARINGPDSGTQQIALRADMDALPVSELNEVPYKSEYSGIMHACGHDAHMTMLLGAAKILQEIRHELKGSVLLIFQPAEEKVPGGAKAMIEAGILENPHVHHVIGQHVLPELPAGKVGFCPGYFMASSDEIYINILGKGGHAAMPWNLTDPVTISAYIITALQQLISRQKPANLPAVLSFGKLIANGAVNVIPDVVSIEGTFRTFDQKYREEIHQKLTDMVTRIADSMGARAEIIIKKGYPALYNDPELTQKLKNLAIDYLGANQVVDLEPRMTSEDFSYYSIERPSVFYRFGTAFHDKESFPLHHPRFNIPDEVLSIGTGLLTYLTVSLLK